MNKILIYTYNPFGNYKVNSAKELVLKLSNKNFKVVVLDCDYELDKLFKAITKFEPDIILGVGQSFEKFVAVERTFRNKIKSDREKRVISSVPEYKTSLPVEKMAKILGCKISDDAGTRNCNFSAYVMLSKGLNAGFIHVPESKYFNEDKFLPRFEKVLDFLRKIEL